MIKFILIIVGIFVFALIFVNLIFRKLRNIFGIFTPQSKSKTADHRNDVLYQDDNVTIHRGEANKDNEI